ncbi:MAG: hypothetical protein Q8R83_04110 [Legionellaceae bacterium]|nr:hypothetical protein [Legionellaceae bacterium]
MLKRVVGILLGFSWVVFAQATPLQQIMPFKLHAIPHHTIKAQTSSFGDEAYTDFTGDWAGQCHVKEGDIDDEITKEHFRIENTASLIKILGEGISDEYEIGKDLSEHLSDENGFSTYHLTFNWINNSTLLFNFISIENRDFPGYKRSINSSLARVIWKLQDDKLIIHSEVEFLENGEAAFHTTGKCEFVRQ